ncbi:hypothetical protein KBC75_03110 [Candidatus Shapirobacteria bacterium]|nr:hypothetical protein [Candidatus Shapirobacteria bacterium]
MLARVLPLSIERFQIHKPKPADEGVIRAVGYVSTEVIKPGRLSSTQPYPISFLYQFRREISLDYLYLVTRGGRSILVGVSPEPGLFRESHRVDVDSAYRQGRIKLSGLGSAVMVLDEKKPMLATMVVVR